MQAFLPYTELPEVIGPVLCHAFPTASACVLVASNFNSIPIQHDQLHVQIKPLWHSWQALSAMPWISTVVLANVLTLNQSYEPV